LSGQTYGKFNEILSFCLKTSGKDFWEKERNKWEFLWSGKEDKIRRRRRGKEKEKSGFNTPKMESVHHLRWR